MPYPELSATMGILCSPFLARRSARRARLDLRADRTDGVFCVMAAHLELNGQSGTVAGALAVELLTMAGWLGLSSVEAAKHSDLPRTLAQIS
jgi:uncharacterized protein